VAAGNQQVVLGRDRCQLYRTKMGASRVQEQERTGCIAGLYFFSGIGLLAIVFDLFNSILDGNEQLAYPTALNGEEPLRE